MDFPQIIAHKNQITKTLTQGVGALLKMNGVTSIQGEAVFTAPKTVEVTKPDGVRETMTPDAVIIAAGSGNAVPPIPGIKENPCCIDSTRALSLETLPKTMVIIGGGVIGLEFACAYSAFGTKVTVVEALKQMLPMLDEEITAVGVKSMKKMGVDFHLECPVQSVEPCEAGAAVICRDRDGGTVRFEAEKVLVAIGRRRIPSRLDWRPEASGTTEDGSLSTAVWRRASPAYTLWATAWQTMHSLPILLR